MKQICLGWMLVLGTDGDFRAQTVSQLRRVTVRKSGQDVIAAERGHGHLLKVGDKIDAAYLEDVKLVFAAQQDAQLFLVVDACGWSRKRPGAGQCGAGRECNLLWLKLAPDWRVREVRSIKYESCWLTIDSGEGYRVKGLRLEVKYDDFSKNLSYALTYDAENPGAGFQISKSRIKEE